MTIEKVTNYLYNPTHIVNSKNSLEVTKRMWLKSFCKFQLSIFTEVVYWKLVLEALVERLNKQSKNSLPFQRLHVDITSCFLNLFDVNKPKYRPF